MSLSRRTFVLSGAAVLGGGAAIYAAGGRNLYYAAITEEVIGETIDAPTAHKLAVEGTITLVDIRRPDEWAKTGSGEGAHRLDMRREDFVTELDKLTGGDKSAAVAVICARGVRSARMTNILTEAGYTNLIDIPEGMLGSRAGPGWIKRGLPLDKS